MINYKAAPLWMKTATGSVAILALFAFCVLFCILKMNTIVETVSLYDDVNELAESLYIAQGYQDTYLLKSTDQEAEAFRETIQRIRSSMAELGPRIGDSSLLEYLQSIEVNIGKYAQSFEQVVNNTNEISKLKEVMSRGYDSITTILNQGVKIPFDEKKNMALITGEELDAYDQELLSVTEKFFTLMISIRLKENNFFRTGEKIYTEQVKQGLITAAETFDEWSYIVETLEDQKIKSYPGEIRQGLADYSADNFLEVVDFWTENQAITSDMDSQKNENLALIGEVKSKTAKLVKTGQKLAISSMALLLGLGLIFGIGISIFTGYQTSKPIKHIASMLKDIAEGEGDLTKRLQLDRSDELGEQAKWFNVFVEKIKQMVSEIAEITQKLTYSSGNLSECAGRMSQGTGQMKHRSNTATVATEDMSGAVRSVASTITQASSNISSIAQSAEEMNAAIREIAKNAEKGSQIASQTVSRTHEASEEINQLGEAAEQIGRVTEAISEISEQTNLLALNATIEAARAGNNGKGFAVVANEIKQLAQQTATATDQIKSRVDNIQEATRKSVVKISEITEIIHEVNDIIQIISEAIDEQATGTRQIADNVSQASEGFHEISSHITQSAATAENLSDDISQVDQGAEQISVDGLEVDQNAHDLQELSNQLKTLVNRFVIS